MPYHARRHALSTLELIDMTPCLQLAVFNLLLTLNLAAAGGI